MITEIRIGSQPQSATSVEQPKRRRDDLSGNDHRRLIGYIGLILPFALIPLAMGRDGVQRWRDLDSISAYYYTGASALFVGMLVALALFLFSYPGYKNKYQWADKWAGRIAALAALLVAFFPTKAPPGFFELTWWTKHTGVIHHVGAVVLFLMFAIFALYLFRLTDPKSTPTEAKHRRNNFYFSCGFAIIVCMAWAVFNALNDKSIFWPESGALVAFALSWLVKGHAFGK